MAFLSDHHAATCFAPRRRAAIFSWLALARQRRALARLDETRLRDLGLSRSEAMREARRPFWDVPTSWCKN